MLSLPLLFERLQVESTTRGSTWMFTFVRATARTSPRIQLRASASKHRIAPNVRQATHSLGVHPPVDFSAKLDAILFSNYEEFVNNIAETSSMLEEVLNSPEGRRVRRTTSFKVQVRSMEMGSTLTGAGQPVHITGATFLQNGLVDLACCTM